MAVVALVAWPFTARFGLQDTAKLTSAVVFGALWLVTLLLAWRLRSQLLLSLQFILLILGPKLFGPGLSSLPMHSFLQWLLTVIIVAGMPLFLLPLRFLRLAKIDTFPPPFRESESS
jgi:hypothetical protein